MTNPAPGAGEVHRTARETLGVRGPSAFAPATLERIPVRILDAHEDIAREVAQRIAAVMRARAAEGKPCVLGLATGSTPIGVYRELIRLHREEGLSFAHVVSFNLDEYHPMSPESVHSYHRYMWENLFNHVDIRPEHVHIPSGTVGEHEVTAHCAAYEAAILAAGGIDFQVLGIGKTGHIGFNEPGSSADSQTRLVTLDLVTRRDAAADFFGEENVPREAITMGIATIMRAREVAILATGEHKATIVRRAVEGPIDTQVAATYLQQHAHCTFYVDRAAAAALTRVATPWLVDAVEWTPELVERAVVWLSLTCGRAILKLTYPDYAEHRLSSLVLRYGSAGAVNGEVFQRLGAKIHGRSKLPRGQRVLCFSPHPDDDVISMGGILRKLVQNENAITVAYMTSGNIAVFDHDVRRYVDFIARLAATGRLDAREVSTLRDRVIAFLEAKAPGDVDSPDVQEIKRLIREAEAVSGIEALGLTSAAATFLNLPFYQTGKVRKDPIGAVDVEIVGALLERLQPDHVFVAGDLSDPHGTHRMCKEAIDRALRAQRDAHPERPAPTVWLYRGAWQEWPVTEANYLVPLSQDELDLKIQAIFRHQSQKDSAPFPGQDDREFWQRVESRNKETARILNDLGLAEYFAMEAYVVTREP
ncbi:MAG: glucosamine-6-phosphate deaminase [Gemmatimonadetes bacterium]|nr:glucosamine-6-phosphate deaminase [Gemmatimonadota bacterium]